MIKKLFVILLVIIFSTFVVGFSFAETEAEKQKRRQEAFDNLVALLVIVTIIYVGMKITEPKFTEYKTESSYMPEFKLDFEKSIFQGSGNSKEHSVPVLKAVWRF